VLLERLLVGKMPPFAPDAGTGEQAGPDAAAQGYTILLVEDDEISSYAIARVLRIAGYEVVVAPDYREALQALDSRRAVDLLLTDVRLTTGTPHGFALGRMARMRRPGIRVLYLTGVTDLPETEVTAALGRILKKPIEPAALLQEIDAALRAV
jgi:CheY-like chemotaxis protein